MSANLMDWQALWLTLKLAALVAAILMLIATPLAWWIARTKSSFKPIVEVLTALPLVLPPSVLGFYALILFNPDGSLGQFWLTLTGERLAFSFSGLVIASLLYSLPFAVQPLTNSFAALGEKPFELGASLGASPWQRFWHIALPAAKSGYFTGFILSFAHTLGEFGVVLMVGGNIPGETRVISVALYEQVESLDFAAAHQTALILLLLCILILLPAYSLNRKAVFNA